MPGRILVIDDEPQITRVLRAALTAQGFDVRTANDPEEGLLLFREWSPDLVVTDLMMPGMSGVEVMPHHPRSVGNSDRGAVCPRPRALQG